MSGLAVPDLSTPPSRARSGFSKGLAVDQSLAAVDREGGRFGFGLIRGVSVITRAEALGHGMWIDAEFLQSTADALNAAERGVKARFTHPSLCADGLGSYLGRFENARVDGDQVRADLHLAEAGHKTKDGDMADYVMGLAEEDPEAFATSIVFTHDEDAAVDFAAGHVDDDGAFQSPDPLNVDNHPHARLAKLHACDVVDEPAANPGGFFANGDNFTAEIDRFFSYALGLDDQRPQTNHLGIDADRARGFASRFLSARGLTLAKKEQPMSDETTPKETTEAPTPAETVEVEVVEEEQEPASQDTAEPEQVDETTEAEAEAKPEANEELSRARDGQKFLDAFGERGGVWFAQGKSFDEAMALHVKAQSDRIEELESRLAALPRGEDEPVDFTPAETVRDEDPAFETQVSMWMRGGLNREEAERKAEQVLSKRRK